MRTEKHSGVFLLKKGGLKTCMWLVGRVSGADEQTSDGVDGGGYISGLALLLSGSFCAVLRKSCCAHVSFPLGSRGNSIDLWVKGQFG